MEILVCRARQPNKTKGLKKGVKIVQSEGGEGKQFPCFLC